MSDDDRPSGASRLLTVLAWTALLSALWLWGRHITEGPIAGSPAAGGVTAASLSGQALPPAHPPLPEAGPRTLAIKAMRLRAPIEDRGLNAAGAVDPPPYDRPGAVAWYRGGPPPGTRGAAVLVGHVDTDRSRAVFYGLSSIKPGQTVSVARSDGSVAEFTVEDVAVFTKDRFDARKVYGPRDGHRAELRLITCGGEYDRARRSYNANVVVSAYLTGSRTGPV